MVLKELIFNRFYFEEGVVVLKELIFNSFYFGRCGGLERTHFKFLLWQCVVVLKELILTISTLERAWWSSKN